MTKPSPVIGWFESCSPDFDLEFDHADRADLHRYCDDLSRTSDSVHLCLTFDVTVEPSGSEHRSLPSLHLASGWIPACASMVDAQRTGSAISNVGGGCEGEGRVTLSRST